MLLALARLGSQRMLGVVDQGSREPARAGHLRMLDHPFRLGMEAHAEVLGQSGDLEDSHRDVGNVLQNEVHAAFGRFVVYRDQRA